MASNNKQNEKTINLALQGGGAHGAFTWGVLDMLCEDGRVDIDGISATSAGAMNAAVYTAGIMEGGLDGARQKMHDFWEDISDSGKFYSPIKPTFWEAFMGGGTGAMNQNMSYLWFENFTKTFSPYDFNPLNLNPLRDVLQFHVDFDKIHACDSVKLFICATNVKTNKLKVFKNEQVGCEEVMASACLPMLFQAIEIEGEHYWDGGYMGNPAIHPLVYDTTTDDIMVVNVNPIAREDIPKKSQEIFNRINEIAFNSSLIHEMRAIAFVKKLVEQDWIKDEHKDHFNFTELRLHAIGADETTKDYSVASKLSPKWSFLTELRDKGREATKEWLDRHYDDLGTRSTLDIEKTYLEPELHDHTVKELV